MDTTSAKLILPPGVESVSGERKPTADRVRRSSPESANQRLDHQLAQRIRFYTTQDKGTISARIAELDREWDVERVLETNASTLILSGLLLGATVSRKWFVLPLVVSGFLFQHALQGWCPPLPLLRRRGFRTQTEIDRERYALKVLRGDFEGVAAGSPGESVSADRVFEAVRKGAQ